MNGPLVETAGQAIAASTISERLEKEERVLTERLQKVREIRSQLASNPDLQSLIDGLSSLGQLYY